MAYNRQSLISFLIFSIVLSAAAGAVAGFWAGQTAPVLGMRLDDDQLAVVSQNNVNQNPESITIVTTDEESAVIAAVDRVSPAVVSIIVTKDLPIIERYYSSPYGTDFFQEYFGDGYEDFFDRETPQLRQNGTERKEVGGGTGFLISANGYIITNKHVVLDVAADYTVLLNDEARYEAEVVARDPLNDLAILKIEDTNLPYAPLGDSANLRVGQSVIAIGNALGEFRNTVSTGVISGLARSVLAGGFGVETEQLVGLIQTDASINLGNSGGPLLNLSGQVIGINTAIAQNAENIGFTIPVNEVKNVFRSVQKYGKIVRPWLGVRYLMVNEAIIEASQLEVDHGALIVAGEGAGARAVVPGSPADKAGIQENDIILEVDGQSIDANNPLAKVISQYGPDEKIEVLIYRAGQEQKLEISLEEMDPAYE